MGPHCVMFCVDMYMSCDIHNSYPGVTFSLRNDFIPNDNRGRVLITDINPNGDNDEDALICRSEILITEHGNWFLHPTQISTDESDRINQIRVSKTMLSGLFRYQYLRCRVAATST